MRRWDDVSLRRGDVVAMCVDVSLRHCVVLMMCCVILSVSLFLCFAKTLSVSAIVTFCLCDSVCLYQCAKVSVSLFLGVPGS